MKVHHLYPDANGESHFEDLEIEWVEQSKASKLSKRFPANGIIFREVEPSYDLDWHPAPRRQYIINLTGAVQLTASDGESRVIRAGEVVLVEDVTGKGHLSKAIGNELRLCIFIPVE
jgi:quercetin dioxygenase-like cupin family protein